MYTNITKGKVTECLLQIYKRFNKDPIRIILAVKDLWSLVTGAEQILIDANALRQYESRNKCLTDFNHVSF
jgi:hypothetical protein